MQRETTFEITDPRITKWAPVVGIVVGVIFLVLGLVAHGKQQKYELTTATVTDVLHIPGTDLSDPDRYTPMIEYVVNGETYTAMMSEGNDYYEVGQQIEIQYDPVNPKKTIDPNPVGPWLLGGFGVLFLLVGAWTGIAALVKGKAEKPSEEAQAV